MKGNVSRPPLIYGSKKSDQYLRWKNTHKKVDMIFTYYSKPRLSIFWRQVTLFLTNRPYLTPWNRKICHRVQVSRYHILTFHYYPQHSRSTNSTCCPHQRQSCFPPLLSWRWLCNAPPPFTLRHPSMWQGWSPVITPMPSLKSCPGPNENPAIKALLLTCQK